MFKIAVSEGEAGETACQGCALLPTKPGQSESDAQIDVLIFETELIVEAEDAGRATDWDYHDAELFELVVAYRKAERELKLLFECRHQQFIKAHFK